MSSFLKLFKKQQYSLTSEVAVNRFTLSQYFEAMQQHKKYVVLASIGVLFATVCLGAGLPFALAHAIEQISQQQQLHHGSPLAITLWWAAGLAAFGVTGNAVAFRSLSALDARCQNYIRQKVFSRLARESAAFYANTMTGSLTSQMVTYTNSYSILQETVFLRGLNLALPLVASVVIVAFKSFMLAGIFLGITLIIAVKTLRDSKARTPYRRARKEATTMLNGFIGDVVSNNAAVRTYAREQHEIKNLRRTQAKWRTAWETNLRIFGRHNAQLIAGIHLLQIAGISLAAGLAVNGHIGLGLVVFAISYFQRVSTSLLELAPVVQTYQGILMEAAPISEILMRQPSIADIYRAKKLHVHHGEILLNTVTYQYEDANTPVFRGVSVRIPAGQSVGLVGRSGGGKTTFTNLLLRFADIQSGSITIDGQDISQISQRSLRNAIAYVPQDSCLFHRSIRENIAYGKPAATDKEIIAAAKRAHIWELIQQLPQGLDTKVGERGVKLSGGQRQRVAIARAILKDAPILVLDEATSALDSESEQYIQASLETLMKGRTSVVIAHRLSTIQKMDRILVMEKGYIAEDGTHTELVKKKGIYAGLWTHQSGGFIG